MVTSGLARARRGASRLGCLLQLALIGAVAYVGVLVADDVMAYFRFKDAMKQETRFAETRTDADMKRRLRAFTDSVKLPPEAKDIQIVRNERAIRIWSEYDAELRLPGYNRVIHLTPSAERPL